MKATEETKLIIAMLAALKVLVQQEDWEQETVEPESPVGKAYAAITAAESYLKLRGQA